MIVSHRQENAYDQPFLLELILKTVARDRNAGWLAVAELADYLCLVEVMLAGEFRSQRIGSEIVRLVPDSVAAAGKRVRLRRDVLNDGATRLYQNLAFQRMGGEELHHPMERHARP